MFIKLIRTMVCVVVMAVFGFIGFHYGYKAGMSSHDDWLKVWGHPYRMTVVKLGPTKHVIASVADTGDRIASLGREDIVQMVSANGKASRRTIVLDADKQVGYSQKVFINRRNGAIVPESLLESSRRPWLAGLMFGFLGAAGGLGILLLFATNPTGHDQPEPHLNAN